MVATLVLNENNIVPDGFNNKLVYNFPNSVSFPNHEIAIQSINMYYSWQNINSTTLQNNSYWFSWPASSSVSIQIVMPDGLYEISDMNSYLQFIMIQNGFYLYTTAGVNMYFAEFVVNPSNYSIQINTYAIPTTIPTGYLSPTNWRAPIGANYAPVISTYDTTYSPIRTNTISNFYKIIGYSQIFATNSQITNVSFTANSYTSSVAPQVQPNPVLYASVSNIENKYATPSSIIGTVSPSVAFGDLITEIPPQFAWNKMLPGTYNGLRLALLGSDISQIKILDPNITIVLVIRDIKDNGLKDALEKANGGK